MTARVNLTTTEKILAYLAGVVFVGVFVVALNFIPYLLWNKAVAPMFGWRHFTFWQIFFLLWAISWLGRIIFGGKAK